MADADNESENAVGDKTDNETNSNDDGPKQEGIAPSGSIKQGIMTRAQREIQALKAFGLVHDMHYDGDTKKKKKKRRHSSVRDENFGTENWKGGYADAERDPHPITEFIGRVRNFFHTWLFRKPTEEEGPWWPAQTFVDCEERERLRPFSARLFLAISDPAVSRFSKWYTLYMMGLIIISCTVFITETQPVNKVYSKACQAVDGHTCWTCQNCRPVNDDNCWSDQLAGINQTCLGNMYAARAIHADLCEQHNCLPSPPHWLFWLEAFCVVQFTLEFVVRILTVTSVQSPFEIHETETFKLWYEYPPGSHRTIMRLSNFIMNPMNVIDGVAVIPFWLEQLGAGTATFTFLRMLRMLRVLRLLRATKLPLRFQNMAEGLVIIVDVFNKAGQSLFIVALSVFFCVVITSSVMWLIEGGTYDHATGRYYVDSMFGNEARIESDFVSIPATFWWALTTFSTVGYGDMYPYTNGGRFIGVFTMQVGVLFMAMPMAIIGKHYTMLYETRMDVKRALEENKRRATTAVKKHLVGAKSSGIDSGMTCFRHWRNVARWEFEQDKTAMSKIRALFEEFGFSGNGGLGGIPETARTNRSVRSQAPKPNPAPSSQKDMQAVIAVVKQYVDSSVESAKVEILAQIKEANAGLLEELRLDLKKTNKRIQMGFNEMKEKPTDE